MPYDFIQCPDSNNRIWQTRYYQRLQSHHASSIRLLHRAEYFNYYTIGNPILFGFTYLSFADLESDIDNIYKPFPYLNPFVSIFFFPHDDTIHITSTYSSIPIDSVDTAKRIQVLKPEDVLKNIVLMSVHLV